MLKKMVSLLILLTGYNILGQHYCERTLQSSDYYGSTELVSLNGYLYHGYAESDGYTPGISQPRKNYILKTDDCLNILDSVRVPLDSAFFRFMTSLSEVNGHLYCLTRSSDVERYDTIGNQVKTEVVVYDAALNLVARHDVTKQLGVYNHNVKMDVLGDSLLMIRSTTLTGSVNTLVCVYGLDGVLRESILDGLYGFHIGPIASFTGVSDYFIWRGQFKFDFSINPLTLATNIDTIIHHNQFDDVSSRAVVSHPNGYTYMVAEWSTFNWVDTHYGLRVFRFDSLGNNMAASVVLGDPNGREEIFNKDAVSIAANGDIIIASGLSVADNGGEWNMLVTRIGGDMKLKWSKAVRVPSIPMLPTFSEGTADNGVTIISTLHDPSTQDFSRSFNDLHYIHMDSTGYYSPLSIEDGVSSWKEELGLYPNPVQGEVFVQGLEEYEQAEAIIIDSKGIVQGAHRLNFPFRLDVSGLASGVYSVVLLRNGEESYSLKMIKN